MASSTFTSTLSSRASSSSTKPSFFRKSLCHFSSSFPFPPFTHELRPFTTKSKPCLRLARINTGLSVTARTLEFSGSLFQGGFGSEGDPPSSSVPGLTSLEDKEERQCPPGLRSYENMTVLRPDMSEDERLALTQKYEEVMRWRTVLVYMRNVGVIFRGCGTLTLSLTSARVCPLETDGDVELMEPKWRNASLTSGETTAPTVACCWWRHVC